MKEVKIMDERNIFEMSHNEAREYLEEMKKKQEDLQKIIDKVEKMIRMCFE